MSQIGKNVNIIERDYDIWYHHEKCFQVSTKMPGIVLEICKILRILRHTKLFCCMDGETNGRVQNLKRAK